MHFWLAFALAIFIWALVRWLVSITPTKNYPNHCRLRQYLDELQHQQTTNIPWKQFVIKFGNDQLKKCIGFESLHLRQLKLFENVFEILKTEHTYLCQLDRLVSVANESNLDEPLSSYNRRLLFGNIAQIQKRNASFFERLSDVFDRDFTMSKVFEVLKEFLSDKSVQDCYVEYIRFHGERNRLVNDGALLAKVPELGALQSLTIVPVQRITRYPLLLTSVLSQLDATNELHCSRDHGENLQSSSSQQSTPLLAVKSYFERAEIDASLKTALAFATNCNKTLDDERKLLELIVLKKQIAGSFVRELVSPSREIILELIVRLYPVQVDGNWRNALKNFSASHIKVKPARAVLLTDMLLLLSEKKKSQTKRVLDHDLLTSIEVEFFKNEPNSPTSTTMNNNNNNSSSQNQQNVAGSSECEDWQSNDSTGSLAGCDPRVTITFRSSGNHYALIFNSTEDEDSFVMAFHRHRSAQL